MYSSDYGNVVYQQEELDRFNQENQCVCGIERDKLSDAGEKIIIETGMMHPAEHCRECGRKYLLGEKYKGVTEALSPAFFLIESLDDGLVKVTGKYDWDAFDVLLEIDNTSVWEYVEYYQDNAEFWLYEHGGQFAAYAAFSRPFGDSTGLLGVDGIWVAPWARRQGIGTRLLTEWLKQAEQGKLVLNTQMFEPKFFEQLPFDVEKRGGESI